MFASLVRETTKLPYLVSRHSTKQPDISTNVLHSRHSVFERPRDERGNPNQPAQNPVAGARGQQNPPRGDAGGFFGRLVGAAGAPPIVPGQFAPGPAQGQLPQQPLAPTRNEPPRLPRHQLFAARPERFQGFVLPDGNWLPWPREDDLANGGVAPQTDVPLERGEEASSTGNDRTFNHNGVGSNADPSRAGDNTTNQPEVQATVSEPSVPLEGITRENATSAREAARAAVLRRFDSSSSRSGNSIPPPSITVNQNTVPTTELPRTVNNSNSDSTTSGRPQDSSVAPSFIPLYDPSFTELRMASTHLSRNLSPLPDLFNSNARQDELDSRTSSLPMRPPRAPGHPGSRSRSSHPRSRGLRELRQQLNIDQLTSTDQLTREAIDERLRALESIESSAARCITELLRCRSMLPRSSPDTSQNENVAASNTDGGPAPDDPGNSTSSSTAVEAPA